jgi:hypothetical protein
MSALCRQFCSGAEGRQLLHLLAFRRTTGDLPSPASPEDTASFTGDGERRKEDAADGSARGRSRRSVAEDRRIGD